jgi:uncharacterized protein
MAVKDDDALDPGLLELDAFLQSDDAPPECMMLSDLDGFLTGIAAGPEPISPAEWLPVVWGEEAPAFTDPARAKAAEAVILGRYQQIAREIGDGSFQPILWRGADGQTIATDWAEGFMMAVALRSERWDELFSTEAALLMASITVLCGDEAEDGFALTPEERRRALESAAEALPDAVCAIAGYWRMPEVEKAKFLADLRDSFKAGDDEPCPCGSGRKFKDCCGA